MMFAILIVLIPAICFIIYVLLKPQAFSLKDADDALSIDHRYNQEKAKQQKEIDAILDKISAKGMNSLSDTEKKKLEEYSKK